jgi:molybdopterin adenylyltransferase
MNTMNGSVMAISISARKGIPKRNVSEAELREQWGIVGDAHAGDWHRQVSLLALESIDSMRAKGLNVRPGAFAENITTQFLSLPDLRIGTELRIGDVLLEVTQIGKECHTRCAIYYRAGDCVMPREGIFARVLRGGMIQRGDTVEVLQESRIAQGSTA